MDSDWKVSSPVSQICFDHSWFGPYLPGLVNASQAFTPLPREAVKKFNQHLEHAPLNKLIVTHKSALWRRGGPHKRPPEGRQ